MIQAKPDSWGFRKFISTDFLKSRASQWLPEDNLTIVCDVSIIGHYLFRLSLVQGVYLISLGEPLFLNFELTGGERTLSGSKFPEEGTRSQKPRHKCHKQVPHPTSLAKQSVQVQISKVDVTVNLPFCSSRRIWSQPFTTRTLLTSRLLITCQTFFEKFFRSIFSSR